MGTLDGIKRRDIVWQEDSWTFGWESESSKPVETTVDYARALAAEYLNTQLSVASGKFLSGEGSGGPSQVEFIVGNYRYILYAPGGRALQIMSSMQQVE